MARRPPRPPGPAPAADGLGAARPLWLLLVWAPSWGRVIAANVLLGVNQGLTWSTTVVMKIDLVGPGRRGLAMGLNEAAGYVAVAATALATGHLAGEYGLRPAPFLLGAAYAALYPAVWGFGQLATGALSDRIGRKRLIVGGMATQAVALALVAVGTSLSLWAAVVVLLGLGTAMVYPTLLAAVGDVAHPAWRARAVGVYRLWRDGGFAVGALLAGVVADLYGIPAAVWTVAALTGLSGLVVAARMYETRPVAPGGAGSGRSPSQGSGPRPTPHTPRGIVNPTPSNRRRTTCSSRSTTWTASRRPRT
ncbi:MFS transporter [Nonomuraea pusilla]|uniref:MFS transporter n=1 Tax=Nonomuraea pusilla TaxID=46177 RepID=UPI003324EBDC